MYDMKNFKCSETAKKKIIQTLQAKIPCSHYSSIEDNQEYYLWQTDLFGNVDMVANFGSTKWYKMQNKGRSSREGYTDFCIECIGYKGKTGINKDGEPRAISGSYYYAKDQCWLVPHFRDADGISIYLTQGDEVYNFARYYLDVMFCYEKVWKTAIVNIQPDERYKSNMIYQVFFNPDKFIDIYMRTVAFMVGTTIQIGAPITEETKKECILEKSDEIHDETITEETSEKTSESVSQQDSLS